MKEEHNRLTLALGETANAKYIGDIKRLKGATCLIVGSEEGDIVEAQFDDTKLRVDVNKPLDFENSYGFTYRRFSSYDFAILPSMIFEEV